MYKLKNVEKQLKIVIVKTQGFTMRTSSTVYILHTESIWRILYKPMHESLWSIRVGWLRSIEILSMRADASKKCAVDCHQRISNETTNPHASKYRDTTLNNLSIIV